MTTQEIETKVEKLNSIIEEIGMADGYGETGGLIAVYDEERGGIVIEDESYAEVFPVTVSEAKVREYLKDFEG